MKNKSPRRQSSRYLKLYPYEQYAVTWMEGTDKMVYLCETIEQASEYLERYKNDRKSIRIDKDYISRPVYGLILHHDSRMPLLDAWTGEPNTNKLDDRLTLKKANCARLNGCMAMVSKAMDELNAIEDSISDAIFARDRALLIAARLEEMIDNNKGIA